MKKIIILLFLFAAVIASANEYYSAKIKFLDGDVKEGYAELPSNQLLDNAIKFKESEKGKLIRYDFDIIQYIIYHTDSGKEYLFEWKNIKSIYGSKKNPKESNPTIKYWSLVAFANPAIKCYRTADVYYIDEEEEIQFIIKNNIGLASVSISFLRPNEEVPTMITSSNMESQNMLGRESKFRKSAAYYFKDIPELVKRIDNKELKAENIGELLKAYLVYMENQNSKK
ncbi:hypothetical protein [Flavobacterium sp. MK4S-17]|uniref:hypothetical protein n=1 Tax=Flavobacterium sp. MK4S-17 TaxID=2543737 RepID=UPI001356995E|nr:hypothetical protein [Flavobacterium sp. MK4S-17]